MLGLDINSPLVCHSPISLAGRRVGRRLLSAAVEWSRQRRATHVEVCVHDFNRDAQRFYQSFGFAPSVDRLVLTA